MIFPKSLNVAHQMGQMGYQVCIVNNDLKIYSDSQAMNNSCRMIEKMEQINDMYFSKESRTR